MWPGRESWRQRGHGRVSDFPDGHCRVSTNWLDGLADALAEPDIAVAGPCFTKLHEAQPRGCGMFWANWALDQHWYTPLDGQRPYEVPLTTGACQAFRHDVFEQLGRYDDGFTRWGSEDVEICLRGWVAGGRVSGKPFRHRRTLFSRESELRG